MQAFFNPPGLSPAFALYAPELQLLLLEDRSVHAIAFASPLGIDLRNRSKKPRQTRMLPSMEMVDEDASLMLRYSAGDVRAFETLYGKHKTALYRYLLRHVRNAAAAADLYQDVWARVIATRERYEPRAKFATFLFHIAHNCAIDFHRRGKNSPIGASLDDEQTSFAEPLAAEQDQPEARAEADERHDAFRRSLDTLPYEQREAFLLYEEAGLSVDEIATATGVGAETAKSRLRYAVSKLKKALRAAAEPHARAG